MMERRRKRREMKNKNKKGKQEGKMTNYSHI
jgi:hypothetical protein